MLVDAISSVLVKYSLLTAFVLVAAIVWISSWAARWTKGRIHGSAIAIFIALGLAGVGGLATGGQQGVADYPLLAGVALLGGAMLRDLAIVATAMGVSMDEFRRGGWVGMLSLGIGLVLSFVIGGSCAYLCGYRDPVAITTIAAGAATYIVGPVTGTAIGATSEWIALSVATGLVKAILVMVLTPFAARWVGLDNPRSAMIFGGVMGTNSGVMAGLAATDPKLVPYGAMTATFYTGLGCLLGPSLFFLGVRSLVAVFDPSWSGGP
jgi:malonate transporter MadM subunit